MKKLVILFMALITTCQLFAQKTLTGTVKDGNANGEAIIGATVQITGTGTGTITDIDGNFSVEVPAGKNQITVSYVGYKSQTINVAGKSHVNVVLHADATNMDEVVVVGYGTMKRSDLTGSVSSINEEQIKQGVNTTG